MNTPKLDLLENEEVLFESGPAVLTNQRLLANWRAPRGGKAPQQALLKDIDTFQKITGGQESRMKPAMIAAGAGGLVLLVELVTPSSQTILQSVLFLAGSLGVVIGLYLALGSVVRIKPHTTVLFQLSGSRHISVSFPGMDNLEADELTRRFLRAKRGL